MGKRTTNTTLTLELNSFLYQEFRVSIAGRGLGMRLDETHSLAFCLPPVFDPLQYAKTEGKGLGDLVTVPNCCNSQILCYQFYVYQTTSDIDTAF